MSIKYTINDLSDVPDELRALYAENEGKFVLQVDGAEPRQALDELRDSNIAMRREIEDTKARYEGVNLDEWHRLLRQERTQRDLELFEAGRGDEVIAGRVAPMQAEHAQVTDGLTRQRDAIKAEVNAILINTALRDAAVKADVRPSAIDDVLARGRQTFRVEDGRLVAYQGDAPLLGRHGASLGVPEWVAYLGRSAPHMFLGSASGEAPGGSQQRSGQGSIITRAAFERLGPWDKATMARSGVKMID